MLPPGDNFTPMLKSSLLEDNFTPGGQSLPLGAKLGMGLNFLVGFQYKADIMKVI
jgi:hypothetical protein